MGFIVCPRSRFHMVSPTPTSEHTGLYQMKKKLSEKNAKEVVFTAEEHLGVQHQIEECAHALWQAGGCRPDCALSDWLMAECIVLEQFILAYAHRQALRQSPRQRTAANGERRDPENQVPKHRRTLAVRNRQSKLALAATICEHNV
jgi:hypothetical protein